MQDLYLHPRNHQHALLEGLSDPREQSQPEREEVHREGARSFTSANGGQDCKTKASVLDGEKVCGFNRLQAGTQMKSEKKGFLSTKLMGKLSRE